MRGLSRIVVVVVIVGIGLVTGSVACGGAAAPRTLVHIGDSLAVGTDPYLPALLRGWTLTSSAIVGRRSDEGLMALRELGPSLPRVVVLSLGTNDDPADVGAFTATVREVVRLTGSRRCVIWTTIARPAIRGNSYAAFNHILRAEAQRSSSFKLVDWAGMVSRNPSYLRPDGVHGVAAGYRARANETARVAKRC